MNSLKCFNFLSIFSYLTATLLLMLSTSVLLSAQNLMYENNIRFTTQPGTNVTMVNSIKRATSGGDGYLITGLLSGTNSGEVFLMRTDIESVPIWSRSYGISTTQDIGSSAKETVNGDILLGGSRGNGGMVMLINDAGGVIWSVMIPVTDRVHDVVEITDNQGNSLGFTALGSSGLATGTLTRLDGNGNLIWQQFLDLSPRGMTKLGTNNGYVVAGQEGGDAVSMKLRENGDTEWKLILMTNDVPGSSSVANSVVTAPGGYVAGGQITPKSGNPVAFTVNFGFNTNKQEVVVRWARIYDAGVSTNPNSVKQFAVTDILRVPGGYMLNCQKPFSMIRVGLNGVPIQSIDASFLHAEGGLNNEWPNKFDLGHDQGYITAAVGFTNAQSIVTFKTNPAATTTCDNFFTTLTSTALDVNHFLGLLVGGGSLNTNTNTGPVALQVFPYTSTGAPACIVDCVPLVPTINRNCNDSLCPWEIVDADVTPAFDHYLWSNGGSMQTTQLAHGNQIVTVINNDNCWGLDNEPIIDIPPVDARFYRATGTQTWTPTNNPWSTGVNPNLTGLIRIKDTLVIAPGADITINDMVFKFGDNADVIIKRGKLNSDPNGYVKGGKLTLNNTDFSSFSCCSDERMWKGIQVEGYKDQSQTAYKDGTTFKITVQGRLQVTNQSLIEDARMAAYAVKDTVDEDGARVIDLAYTGGIITASNSVFKNNGSDVVLLFYLNFNPFSSTLGNFVRINNLSSFSNNEFLTTRDLLKPGETGFGPEWTHVMLALVDGIMFRGNTFKHDILSHPTPVEERGTGILAFAAGFKVLGRCLQPGPGSSCQGWDEGEFTTLTYGINANGLLQLSLPPTISNNVFGDCIRGVLINGMDAVTITENTFGLIETGLDGAYGLYLRECSGYQVEANEFIGLGLSSPKVGVIAWRSGETTNRIYRNSFVGFEVATLAMDDNWKNGSPFEGLQIKCNEYTNDDVHISVVDGEVARRQGSCLFGSDKPAGNRFFSHNCPSVNSENDFLVELNMGGWSTAFMEYAHHAGNASLFGLECASTNPPIDVLNSPCGTLYNSSLGSSGSCSNQLTVTGGKQEILGNIASEEANINGLNGQIDGGNTQALLNAIATQPNGQLKNTIGDAAPFVSNTVLLALIFRQPALPTGHLLQIMTANAPLDDVVFDALTNLNLPKGVQTQIANNQTGTSAMEELKSEISFHTAERSLEVDRLIRFVFNDELQNITDRLNEVEAILLAEKEHNRSDQAAAIMIVKEKFPQAQQHLNIKHPIAKDARAKLMEVEMELRQRPEKSFALKKDKVKETIVRTIANDQSKHGCVQAQSMLKLAFGDKFQEAIRLPNKVQLKMAEIAEMAEQEHPDTDQRPVQKLKAYPNPFSDYTTIEAIVPEGYASAKLVIYNMVGTTVFQAPVQNGFNKLTVSKDDLKDSGIYFYVLYGDDELLERDKMVIIE